MTFPNVIKTAPEHPNIALMYPILIERGPAAGGEALTDQQDKMCDMVSEKRVSRIRESWTVSSSART